MLQPKRPHGLGDGGSVTGEGKGASTGVETGDVTGNISGINQKIHNLVVDQMTRPKHDDTLYLLPYQKGKVPFRKSMMFRLHMSG
jgi:hypothetical protein